MLALAPRLREIENRFGESLARQPFKEHEDETKKNTNATISASASNGSLVGARSCFEMHDSGRDQRHSCGMSIAPRTRDTHSLPLSCRGEVRGSPELEADIDGTMRAAIPVNRSRADFLRLISDESLSEEDERERNLRRQWTRNVSAIVALALPCFV